MLRFRGLRIQRIGFRFKSIPLAHILLLHLTFAIISQGAQTTFVLVPLPLSHLLVPNQLFIHWLLFIHFISFWFLSSVFDLSHLFSISLIFKMKFIEFPQEPTQLVTFHPFTLLYLQLLTFIILYSVGGLHLLIKLHYFSELDLPFQHKLFFQQFYRQKLP